MYRPCRSRYWCNSRCIYAATNTGDNFSWGEFAVAVGGGAVAGALIGSGAGLLMAGATATTATLATAAVGAGTAAAFTEADYMASNRDSFDTKEYAVNTSIAAGVGAVSAIAPATRVGIAVKAATYISGAELQYGVLAKKTTPRGFVEAGVSGLISAGIDVGISSVYRNNFSSEGFRNALVNQKNLTMRTNVLKGAIDSQIRRMNGGIVTGLLSGYISAWANKRNRDSNR